LRQAIAQRHTAEQRLITEGFCQPHDVVMLIMPQDAQAPKGRLIKPQAQVLRELLERGCIALCCTAEQMADALTSMTAPPKLIITDSQVFDKVYSLKPESSRLTSFSILFARYKGDIETFVAGAKAIEQLTPSSRILIAEACAHAPKSEDIGRVKLPRMLRRKVGEALRIDVVAGNEFPCDLSPYDLVIHCGACMFNRRHVLSRIAQAAEQGVAITNYGVAIAALQGILDRVQTQ
ncbi:MAG: [Alistipes sp.]|nr:[FeFe] hydrogenase H-cluster maturation GTPase HydF [Alistipes sp.]